MAVRPQCGANDIRGYDPEVRELHAVGQLTRLGCTAERVAGYALAAIRAINDEEPASEG